MTHTVSIKRKLLTEKEIVSENANLLIASKLKPVEQNEKLYPNQTDTHKILDFDKNKKQVEVDIENVRKLYDIQMQGIKGTPLENMMLSFDDFKKSYEHSSAVKSKDKTFHYLPYDFKQSGFEKEILKKTLNLSDFKNKDLEIYYNGERGLTEFVIKCFAKEKDFWKNIGKYTTDFLIIKRKGKQIYKALIIETKGKGFENDPVFQNKRKFVETDFLEQNKEKFGYNKFDFLYLTDRNDIITNLSKMNNKINNFFND